MSSFSPYAKIISELLLFLSSLGELYPERIFKGYRQLKKQKGQK